MIKKIIGSICILSMLVIAGGCSFGSYNEQISNNNAQKFTAFSEGMNAATTEGARIAIAMAFASGMGMQNLARPETARDYIGPIASLVTPFAPLFYSDNKESSSMSAGRDLYINSNRADRTTSSHSNFSEVLGGSAVETYTPANYLTNEITELAEGSESGSEPVTILPIQEIPVTE